MVEPLGDGLYSADVVSAFDGDRFVVLGAPAGPAGSASVELPDGSRWTVDHADPSLLVGVEVESVDPASSRALVVLLGGDTALMLVDEASPAIDSAPTERYWVARQRGRQWGSRGSLDVVSMEVGRMVVLADLASDPGVHPLGRLVATAELAERQRASKALTLLDPIVLRLAASSADLADDVDEVDLAGLDPRVAADVASMCRGAALVLGDAGSGLREMGERVHRYGDQDIVSPMLSAHEAFDDASFAPVPPRLERAAAPSPPALLTQRRISDGLLAVQLVDPVEDAWARVLRRDGLAIVGLAPVDRRARAEVPVPPDIADDDLVVDVVDAQQLGRSAHRAADSVRAAVRAGRDAARAMRLGEHGVAAVRWERCSDLWERVGDRERAEHALSLASSGLRLQRSGSLVCDAVLESLPRT